MMFGLPSNTDIRKVIPKEAFFSSKGIKGKERSSFDSQVHSMIIRSIISPDTVNLPGGRISAVYVMEVQLNQSDLKDSNLMLLNKLGHKTVYILTCPDKAQIAVVENLVFRTDFIPLSDVSIHLEGLDIDKVWENIVRSVAGDLSADMPLKDAIIEYKRVSDIDREIQRLEKKFRSIKQNHEQREIFKQIQELKKDRDNPPVIDPWPNKFEWDIRSFLPRCGTSVTARVRELHQPPGGYIDPKSMEEHRFEDGIELGPENIKPSMMGLVVDYLTRFAEGDSVENAFHISILGGKRLGRIDEVEGFVSKITGLDDESIANACRLTLFDAYVRAGYAPKTDPSEVQPDHQTCENIRVMVKRAQTFFEHFGPVVDTCPIFLGGYTDTISFGDGDFLTKDTIWDFKVSQKPPTIYHTLQLAIYFLLSKHSMFPWFSPIINIGIFNPRLNVAYTLNMLTVPEDVIREIETEVIGYEKYQLSL